jgi:hypothetical protein
MNAAEIAYSNVCFLDDKRRPPVAAAGREEALDV